eukprot:jgi/Mesen1/631/ME000108S10783
MASFSSLKTDVFGRQQRRQHYADNLLGLNAFDRHKKFINDYVRFYGGSGSAKGQLQVPVKTDSDTLRETFRFVRTEEDDSNASWEQRLARRYYDKLFKEYCIADMSRYKENKIGLRWRVEKEVLAGKGQFTCGSKGCDEKEGLRSFEVNFAYQEAGEEKQALVKLRVCPKALLLPPAAVAAACCRFCQATLEPCQERELERKRRRQEKKAARDLRHGKRSKQRGRSRREGGDGEESDEEEAEGAEDGEAHEAEAAGEAKGGPGAADEGREAGSTRLGGSALPADESIWEGKRPELEPNKDEEFEDYFRGMFL